MNRDDILTMEPGRELDFLVAEKILNYLGSKELFVWGYEAFHKYHFSSDISAAFKVVRKMKEDNWTFCLTADKEKVSAIFYWDQNKSFPEIIHESETLAICQCALLAVLDL